MSRASLVASCRTPPGPASHGPVAALCGCPASTRAALEAAGIPSTEVPDPGLLHRRLRHTRAVVAGPGADAAAVLATCRTHAPGVLVVAWRPGAERREVRALLHAGVHDVVFEPEGAALAAALAPLMAPAGALPGVAAQEGFEGIVGRSRSMADVVATCAEVAATPATVLILGETGTGKELLSQAIHRRSGRTGRFVAVNCGAIPEALIESELFGHVRGAFTGAAGDKAGLFQHAHGGTLFLDEVGSLPLTSQFSLLRVLQQGRVRPVGGGEEVPVDVRIVAATSELLDAAVKEGRFRPDLFYRLDVIRVTIPPLRDRREDVPALFEAFCREHARQYGLTPPEVTPAFLDGLGRYDWPGNARQVRNLAERLVLTRRGARLDAPDLAALLACAPGPEPVGLEPAVTLEAFLGARVTALERQYLEERLRQHAGRMQATATAAGVSRRTLLRTLRRLGIDRRRFGRATASKT